MLAIVGVPKTAAEIELRCALEAGQIVGYQGTAEFNFTESRFRERAHDCNCRPATAAACE
jgi:hypothetical protein